MAKRKTTSRRNTSSKKKAPTKKTGTRILPLLIIVIIVVGLWLAATYSLNNFNPSDNVAQSKETVHPGSKTPEKKHVQERSSSSKPGEQPSDDNLEKAKSIKSPKLEVNETINDDVPQYSDINDYYFTTAFDFAWPKYDMEEQIVEHEGFTLSYDEKYEQPIWVAYKLTKERLENKVAKRTDNFREDPNISSESATLNDYKKSGYDRGHLAPAADFSYSKESMSSTFYLSNMSPQLPNFNRGIWKILEEQVRSWATQNNELFVVTGPIFQGKPKDKIGRNKVGVPTHYYKVILDIQPPEVKGIGFILEHKKYADPKSFFTYAVSIDKVEEMTGLDFFPNIPNNLEDEIEENLYVNRWK